MTTVDVTPTGEHTWEVEVRDASSSSRHRVTLRPEDRDRLVGSIESDRLIRESFEFLLEREPKESILSRFDLPEIGRYFPEYETEIRRRLGAER